MIFAHTFFPTEPSIPSAEYHTCSRDQMWVNATFRFLILFIFYNCSCASVTDCVDEMDQPLETRFSTV